MVAPPPAFTIRHPDYAKPDNITPFRDYDIMGPLWDPVPFFSSKQRTEEWTTDQLITFDQLEEYGVYYVGDRSDMYAVSHFVYHVEGQYMPVFRKITGYDMFTDYGRMRVLRKRNRNRRGFPRPVPLSLPPPSSNFQGLQPKRLDIFINAEGGVKIYPKPNGLSAPTDNGNDYMEEGGGNEDDAMKVDDDEEGGGNCFWDEIIEDYFTDKASSSESPGSDDRW